MALVKLESLSNLDELDDRYPEQISEAITDDALKSNDADAMADSVDSLVDEESIVRQGLDWRTQLTFRSLAVGTLTGILLTFVAINLSLSGAGVSPGYSVIAALLGYAIMRPMTALCVRLWSRVVPFTKEENCIVQGVATSIQSLQHSLGVSTWFWALHENSAAQIDGGNLTFTNYNDFMTWKAENPERFPLPNTLPVDLPNMIGLAMMISFTGVLIVTVFRKLYIVDLRLPFPSPLATAVMIKSLHTKLGRKKADRQLKVFSTFGASSFIWQLFNWLTSPAGCKSFSSVPIFGLPAVNASWLLNIADYLQFLGIGLILTPNVSYSICLGGVLSYGVVYPWLWEKGLPVSASTPAEIELETTQGGYWFYQGAGGMDGFYGYKIMWGMTILLADGLFALCMMVYIMVKNFKQSRRSKAHSFESKPSGGAATIKVQKQESDVTSTPVEESAEEREFRINCRVFTEQGISNRYIYALFIVLTVIGCVGIPLMYPVPWYMVLISFLLTPIFALIGNYIAGLTDWNLVSNFAKLVVIIFGVWAKSVDPENAVLIGLITCGIVYCGASNSTDIIGDLYTGFLLRASPKAMIIAQLWGFFIGTITCPLVFLSFISSTPDTGFQDSRYPNSYGLIYRAMALLGANGGFGSLPKYALEVSYGLFAFGFFMPMAKLVVLQTLKNRGLTQAHGMVQFFWPAPMAMGIPFIAGVHWVVPVGIGLLIKLVWKRVNEKGHENFYQVVAAGILAGTGIFAIPAVILTLAGATAPDALCIKLYDYSMWKPVY